MKIRIKPGKPVLTTVTISGPVELEEGQRAQYTVTMKDQRGNLMTVPYSYVVTQNPNAFSIDANGNGTALPVDVETEVELKISADAKLW